MATYSSNILGVLKKRGGFHKFLFYYDGVPCCTVDKIDDFFEGNKDCIVPICFSECSPEFNPVEECWNQGKDDIVGSVLPPTFDELKGNVSEYY